MSFRIHVLLSDRQRFSTSSATAAVNQLEFIRRLRACFQPETQKTSPQSRHWAGLIIVHGNLPEVGKTSTAKMARRC
jgi:hypothetical protein